MQHLKISLLLALGMLAPHAARAQAAALSAPSGPVQIRVPDVPTGDAKQADIEIKASGVPVEIANVLQLLRTRVGPGSVVPQIVRCDPRTLASSANDSSALRPQSPNTLNLGRNGQVVIADKIFFVGTSNGEQCPEIGKTIELPPYLLDLVR